MKTKLEELYELIELSDRDQTIAKLDELRLEFSNSLQSVNDFVSPQNIMHLKEKMTEKFGIEPRMMQLRHRQTNRAKRAVMFLLVIRTALVKKT